MVPFIDLKIQYQEIKKDIDKAIAEVVWSTHFANGEAVGEFENNFANYLGVKHCVGLNSGTDALVLGIRGLGLGPGDEIILPANTFIATAEGVSLNGSKPVFVDIDERDFGININDLKKKINPRTKAIIAVHLYGQPDKLNEILDVIRKSGKKIYLIEDACQAHGATYNNKKVGNFGIFSAFSFYPGKNLGAYGEAGAMVTNDSRLDEICRKYREHGQKKKYFHDVIGVNSRLDTIQAAVLNVKLKHLDIWNEKRRKAADYYSEKLNNILPFVITPEVDLLRRSVYHLYPIRVQKRDGLQEYLKTKDIQTLVHYPLPLHLQKAYEFLGYKKGDLPIVEKVSRELLSLPIFPEIKKEQMDFVVDSIQEFFSK
jgi:dTDP-4-amino-4,6-dideoxygalactose transaminase